MQTTGISQRRSRNPLDTVTRQVASTLITTYQKQLSPRKGFSCAYRVLHRSESCSQYAKRTILELGLGQALPLIRQRFQACKAANQTLKAQGCRATGQRKQPTPLAIVPQNTQAIAFAPPSWMAIEDGLIDDASIDSPDENSEPGDEEAQPKRTGGGSFRKPPVASDTGASTGTTDGTTPSGSDSNWGCDTIDCASLGCDAIDCSSADWSAMNCNGADCSGLDCGSLDCGSCDVGSCDCGS